MWSVGSEPAERKTVLRSIPLGDPFSPWATELGEPPKRAYGNLQVRKGAKRSAPPLKPHSHSTITGRASARFIRKGMRRWQLIMTGGGQMIQRSCRKQ